MILQSQNILIVEDDRKFLAVLEFSLKRAGATGSSSTRAAQALVLAKQKQFDFVISDYYLPDYPGTDFIRLLRQMDRYQCVPVILWSARVWELDEQRLRDELSILMLSKNCPMQELVKTVSSCLAFVRNAR